MTGLTKRARGVAGVCLRRNLPPHLLLCFALLGLSFLVLWPSYWDKHMTAGMAETLLPITGLLLLTPLFLPEQDETVLDVIRVRLTPVSLVYGIRAVCALIFVLLIPALAVFALRLLHCDAVPGLWASVVSSGLFLGGLGALAFARWGNLTAAYMVPTLYFILCVFTGQKKMEEWGAAFLCPFSGDTVGFKPALFCLGLVLLAASIPLRCRKQR